MSSCYELPKQTNSTCYIVHGLWSSELGVDILVVVVIQSSSLVIQQMVGHGYSDVLRAWRRHLTHAKKVGSHSTTVSWLRKVVVRIVQIDIVGHVEARLTRRRVLYIPQPLVLGSQIFQGSSFC